MDGVGWTSSIMAEKWMVKNEYHPCSWKIFIMDENECALMKLIHDDVDNGDVGHNQVAIMFKDVIHDNRSTNVFFFIYIK